jgi:hypothetical protein
MGSARVQVPMRPVTPPAPDSLSVPQQKDFTHVRSVDRGAAADIKSRIRSVAEVQRFPGTRQGEGGDWYEVLLQEIEHDAVTGYQHDAPPSDDPTWGFSVFITSYTPAARERVPLALENWIRTQELWLEREISHPIYREELIERFKLDVVFDNSLEGASDDRIRAEFRAWMAGLGLTPRGDQSPPLVGVPCRQTPKETFV